MIFALAVLVSLIGCSLSGTDGSPQVQLTNRAEQPILYLAWQRQAANTVDPNLRLPRDQYPNRIVGTGETVTVEAIRNWSRREAIRFFLYTAPRNRDTATYARTYDVNAAELITTGNRVTIEVL